MENENPKEEAAEVETTASNEKETVKTTEAKETKTVEQAPEEEKGKIYDPLKDPILRTFKASPARSQNERFGVKTEGRLTKRDGAGLITGVVNYTEYSKVYAEAETAIDRARTLNERYHD